VTLRQQPDTAKGVIFVSLEDETGVVQVIAWRHIRAQQCNELLNSRLLVGGARALATRGRRLQPGGAAAGD
jgi:hypothetical protein